jgi:hypothetical protein
MVDGADDRAEDHVDANRPVDVEPLRRRPSMPYLEDVLRLGEIHHEPFPGSKTTGIFLTRGMQLLGTFDDFQRFKRGTDAYKGWHRHHVFERQDWSRLNIETLAPRYEDQLCVLLPERAHIGRVNSVLRSQAPQGAILPPRELLKAYEDAYEIVGDYCGGGERLIRRELSGIVRGTLRLCGQM